MVRKKAPSEADTSPLQLGAEHRTAPHAVHRAGWAEPGAAVRSLGRREFTGDSDGGGGGSSEPR